MGGTKSVAEPSDQQVCMEDFRVLQFVGRGQLGKVYQVQHQHTQKVYAMKVLKKQKIHKLNCERQALLERNILSQVVHPFVVQLKFALQSSRKLCLILEYAEGGELLQHLKEAKSFPEPWIQVYAAEILAALDYLHANKIVYRDLKLENVLLDGDGHVKLTDLGMATYITDEVREAAGTPVYLAPEIIKEQPSGFGVDLWALGILLFELATGHVPFAHKNRIQLCRKILFEEPAYPPSMSFALANLIQSLLKKKAEERITIERAKAHAFFSGANWHQVARRELLPPQSSPQQAGPVHPEGSPLAYSPVLKPRSASEESFPDFHFVCSEELI